MFQLNNQPDSNQILLSYLVRAEIELKIELFQLYNQPNPLQRDVGQVQTSLQGDFKLSDGETSSFFQVLIENPRVKKTLQKYCLRNTYIDGFCIQKVLNYALS